jgi:hypothetical protein
MIIERMIIISAKPINKRALNFALSVSAYAPRQKATIPQREDKRINE